MELRTIGGLSVSTVGLGCNNFGARADEERSRSVIAAALDAGITLFDTADSYGMGKSEEILGKYLKGHRDEVVIATKFASKLGDDDTGGASPRWIRRAVDDSLRRLDMDVIDLYQQHWFDPDVPLEETLGALQELVDAGKVRFVGCSNFNAGQIDDASSAAEKRSLTPFVSVQNELSLLKQDALTDALPECERKGLSFLPFFPLAAGMLTGKYRRGEDLPEGTRLAGARNSPYFAPFLTDEMFARVERLEAWAAERDHTVLDLAFAWLLAFPPISSVIAGATRPEQIAANVAAGDWTLTAEERDEVTALVS